MEVKLKDRAMTERLRKACDALSEDDWSDIVGAMDQRDGEFCCNAAERDEGRRERDRVGEVIEALREWRRIEP